MRIGIIGGGLTGLTAAFILSKKHKVTVLEKEDYLGGMASSYTINWDGKKYPITKTYHHILDGDKTTVGIIKKLGLYNKYNKKKVKQGFIYKNKIMGFSTPLEILKFPIHFSDKIRLVKFIILDSKKKNWDDLEGLNTKKWITEKAGKINYDVFFNQLVRNKFHESPEKIAASWFGTRFFKESSSFLKKFGWLRGGVVQIINNFEKNIRKNKGRIITGSEVVSIRNKRITYVKNKKRKKIQFDLIVSTVPPEIFLKIMDKVPKELENSFKKIKYLSCICATIGLKKKMFDQYWLNILDKLPFVVLFNHTALYEDAAPKGKSVCYILTYLKSNEKLWKKSEKEIKKIYVDAIKRIIPDFEENIEWFNIFKVKNAEAVYKLGFKNPPTSYDGIYFGGIYKTYPKIRNMASAMEEGIKVANEIERTV
ncbi:MAG: FAD-dependent oxidoreductase [Candidatus Aenigmatarchaeota archaeon]